jgi:hypothetical protein
MKKRDLIRSVMHLHRGEIVAVDFIKRDGSDRLMVCRQGVSKDLKGVGLKFDPAKYGLLSVYDMQKRAYRFVCLDTVREIRAGGNRYVFH